MYLQWLTPSGFVEPLRRRQKKPRRRKEDTLIVLDTLIVVGSPFTSKDHIEVILNDLSEEYNSFIMSVTSHLDPYIVQEIEALLLVQEEHFDKYKYFEHSIFQTNHVSGPSNNSQQNRK